ncbi:MAG: PilZ domain-containing protein, partial [Deltaproteobacteria bacterium]|nr:PilZ domain-containing protein [Deltaproteobacteria bacterium]
MADFALFKYIEKPTLLRAFIIQEDGSKVRLEAVARIIAEPYLELKFRPNELPIELIKMAGKILLSLDTRAGTVSMYTHVDEVISPRVLRVLGTESFSFAQQREYFRAIKVLYCKETMSSAVSTVEQSVTVNMSGSGTLISSESKAAMGDTFELEFHVPEADPIECKGLVVRVDDKLRGGYELALHFHNIEHEDRDRVISFCLAEQRRQLR